MDNSDELDEPVISSSGAKKENKSWNVFKSVLRVITSIIYDYKQQYLSGIYIVIWGDCKD